MEHCDFPRVGGCILANILINGTEGVTATVRDVSASGIAFFSDADVSNGDRIVAHLDGGARLEGAVAQLFEVGFAIKLDLSEHKRQRLARSLAQVDAGQGLRDCRLTGASPIASRGRAARCA